MITKEDGHFSKKPSSVNSRSDVEDFKFFNFNLNQNHKCSILPSNIHSFSKSNCDTSFVTFKSSDYVTKNNFKEKRETSRSKSLTKDLSFKDFQTTSCDAKEEEKELLPRWKKKTSNLNNSTLSLHISAYENSIDASSSNANESFSKKFVKEKFIDSSLKFQQNSFEFPRQMNGNEPNSPEIMQFKASQKLLLPNQNPSRQPEPSTRMSDASSAEGFSNSQGVSGPSGQQQQQQQQAIPVQQPQQIIQQPQQQPQPQIQQQQPPAQQQQQQQQPPVQQQQQQQQQSVQRDVIPLFNERVRIIMEPNGDPKRKIKSFEEIRDLFDELYLKEHTPIVAQASVQIFQAIFQTVPVAFYDDKDTYQLRKSALDLVIRFVPLDQYKSSTKMFEDLFYLSIPKENELNAIFMIRYVIDMLRSQKVQQRPGILQLISNLRRIVENLYDIIVQRPEVFSRPQFVNDNIDNEEYRSQFLDYLHFDVPIKPKRIHVFPRASNSIKVLTEFSPMTHLMILLFKDEVAEEVSHLLRIFTAYLNYNLPKTNVDPEYSALFQETQLKILNFICMLVKPSQNGNLSHLINPYRADIAIGVRKLLRTLEASAINYRKEVLVTIKALLATELKVDLLDLIPDFCFEEIICGPPTIITPTFRSELFIIKADAFHNVRQSLDWVTFQHITMIIIRDYMDFTLSPALQGIYGKLVLNFIDACQKAENGSFPQLVIGYSYDSARLLYSNLFFSLTHRLDVVTQECTHALLASGSKSELAPKINEFYDSDEEDSEKQSWMKEKNLEDLIEVENIDEPMDEFERDDPVDPENGHSFVSIALKSFAKQRTKKLNEKISEVLNRGNYKEKNKKRQADAARIEKVIEKTEKKLSKHSFKTKDSRTQMVWFNRPLARRLEVLPLIKSHSEIPPEKCNTFIPPEPFPYSIQELRNIYKHYTGALRTLFVIVHFDDDLKSSNPPLDYYIALNKLFRNFIDVFELCNFSPSPNPPFVAPHNQAINSSEDKELFEYFTVIFSSIHPAVYERILKHHLPYFIHRATVSFSVQQVLLHLLQTPVAAPTNMVIFDYIYENMDILFLYDDDDKHRVDFFSKLIRLILTFVMQNFRAEPLLKDYVSKIQTFFYKLITKTVYYVVRMYDASHLQAMLKTILRICGAPQAEHFYKLFLPLFPSFLHWFSALQNVLAPESLQEYFIELCLSLPARLSSLVPYMSLLADPEINSFQNPILLSQQGLRAIELCLDNYSAINVRDFFGPTGIARLNENLWNFISTSMDHQMTLHCLKILGKLSSLNRNALCDIQKLSFTPTENKPDKPTVVVYFERSGKSFDDFVASQLSLSKVSKDFEGIVNIQDSRAKMYTCEKHEIDTKPLHCNLLLRPILSHCVSILKNSLLSERNFTNVNRSDSAWLLLTWIRSGFDSYGAQVDKNELIARLLVANREIMELSKNCLNNFNVSFASEIPFRSEMSLARQMYIDCITGLSYAAANGDVKDDMEAHWEELIDFFTLQLHVETSVQYFGGILSTSGVYPVAIDAFVLVDAIIAVLCEPHSRFHACAIYTLLRMIQTCLSFAPTPEEALNIPLFHFFCQEIAQLCTHPEPCHRLGGIYLLEIVVENLPTNFLFAAFDTLFSAVLDVLHFGDDDISLTSQESAMVVGKKLLDKVCGQKSEDLYKHLAGIVLKHAKSSSFWTNKLLCEILIYLQAQDTVSYLQLFSIEDVQGFYKQHEIEFMNSKMEFRYVQLNLLVHLLNCAPHLMPFTAHTSNYLQMLSACFVHSDEIVSNSPNYETAPPHPPNGTNLVPSSPLFKPYGTPFFIERLKQFRSIVAGASAALCLNFYKSQALTAISFSFNFEIHDIQNAEEAAKFLLKLHATTVLKRTDQRFDFSVAALCELGHHMVFSNKNTFITEIINILQSDPTRTYLYKALNALVKQKGDLLHRQISSLIGSTNPQYFSLCQSLGKIVHPNESMVEHLLAFLNVCRTIEFKDDKLFNDLFSMLSSKRILAMFELGEIDLFSPAVIFLGSDPECAIKANNFFLSPVNLKDELKRKAYLTLVCHPDGQHFLTSLKHCEQLLIDLIELRVVKSGNFERAAEVDPMILDEFVFKIFTKFASAFPNWFARNKKLAEFLRRFLLSDYFRGNYLLQDFCIGKNDRLRLTNFKLSLAAVPDLVTNLLINYFVYNPTKYEILLALCSLLPQMTFADNGSLKRFISNFIVPRTTLLWRRGLLKFAMSKFVMVFNNFPKPSDDEDTISRQNDCQLYLGNFYLYVVVPCFSYALERFRARQVFNCEFDKLIGKRRWKPRHFRGPRDTQDLVDGFCEKVLIRFQQHFQSAQYGPPVTIRPELSHGILQMAILLLQRASSHIHTPGSKKQSKHLQTIMQSAWGSLTQTGIYVDRWLRSVAYFLLSNVMNAFYIKRDIVYQLFDCLILLPDIRENPIAQKALDGIATHSARRRDECYQGLVEKIKEALTVDGFNLTKIGNVLFMLANNYEAFFPARGTLLPSVVFVLVRVQASRQANILNFIFDGLETIVGWEDLRTKKFNLIKDNLIRSANASQDPNVQRRIQNQIATLTRSPNFLAADRVLSDTISLLLCRIMASPPESERGKRFLSIFHKAIQPRLFCRVICLRLEKILTIRDISQGQQQQMMAQQIQPMINTIKILTNFIMTASPDSVFHCILYLQPVFAGSLKSQNISFMETSVNLIAKAMEITKELSVNEQKFRLIFQTLTQYFAWTGDNFIAKNDWNDISFMLNAWKTICMANETSLMLFTGPLFIKVAAHMARMYRSFIPASSTAQVTSTDLQAAEKRQFEALISVLEVYIDRAAMISVETMALYLKEVITPLVKVNESLNAKILELVCKTLEEASKPPHVIKQTHTSIVGALTRYHTQAIMKSSIAVNSFISTVAAITKGKWDEDYAEVQIPFYLGLTAHSHVDAKIRAVLLDIYDSRLPKNIFERLCYLLMIEPWQLVNISGILPLMVEMLLRCVKDIAFEREQEPAPAAPTKDEAEEDSPMTDPSSIVAVPAIINPPCAFWTSIRKASVGKPSTFEVQDIPDPNPCPQGIFTKTNIKFLPKRLKSICEDYFGAIERSNDLFNKKFPEFMVAYLSVIYQEPDLAGKIFVELFTSLWSTLNSHEQEFITEIYGQFLQLPIFNGATEKTSKYFWQTIQKCNPPMLIDRTKITATLSGLKNVHSAVYGLEMAIPKSVNLLEATTDLRQMYRILDEQDLVAETWRIYGYSNHVISATVLYNQSKFVEALEEVQKAQNDYMQLIKIGEQHVDSVNIGIKNDYDIITNLGVLCLKQLGQWEEVYKHACKVNNAKLGSEAIFYLLKDNENHWTEFENMTRSFSTSEDVSDAFLALCNHILHTAHENNKRYPTLFSEGGTVDRLGSVVGEKWRRLPSFFSPKYHEVLSELSLYIDVLDGVNMFKEVNQCSINLQQTGTNTSLKTFLDTTMKQTVLHWHHRNISPSDTLEFATKFYKFRIVFLMLCNKQLKITDPELKDPRLPTFTLTPMHSVSDFSLKQSQHFSRYSLFSQAKKVIGGLPVAENFNALDGCLTICTVIKASMKQYQYQPTTVAYTNLKKELTSFLQADIKQFSPDCVALYASTRGQIFSLFKQIAAVEENFRVSLKLLSTIDDINQAHTATKCYKMYSNFAFDRYMDTREPAKGLAAVVGLLKYISRECQTKASRHILRLIYLVKRLSSLPSPPDLLPTFYALGPKCRMINFVPYLHLLASEVAANSNEAFATLLILVAQVYPLHVLHAIYLQVGNEKFMKHIHRLQESQKMSDEDIRIGIDFRGETSLTELHEYVYFNQRPDYASLTKMEAVNRNGFPYQTWMNRKQLKTSSGIFAAMVYIINKYVPADVAAFIKVINGLEQMDNHFIERYYRNWTYIWDILTNFARTGENGAIENVGQQLEGLYQELCKFLESNKNGGSKIAALQELKEFPRLDGTTEERLQAVADYISLMEDVIKTAYSTIKLEDLSQELYNFTGKLGRVISFSSFLEPHTSHCIPHIDLFVPVVQIYAKNGSFIKQLDVRLSNGKIVSYFIEPASIDQYFASATNSFSSLNLSAEKFPDTNRRGAIFRIPNIFQLDGVRLFETCHISLNKHQSMPLAVRPLSFIMAESTAQHPFKSIANYYSNLSSAMATDETSEFHQALSQQEKEIPPKCLYNWFINRYEDDLGCVWYLRKSISTQMALFSLVQYAFDLNPMDLENLYFDMSFGKLFNVNQTFSERSSDVPFRLTPAFSEFFGLSINGHFIPTMVAMAQAFVRKRFEDYFRPFYWDFWVRACQKEGKKITATEINEFDHRMNVFKQRLAEIANYNGDSDSTVFKLCNDSQSIEKRAVLPADLYPWF